MDLRDQEEFIRILRVRSYMRKEIAGLQEILRVNGNVGMDESLVTANGSPRTDIDVSQVKYAREKIIREETDYKVLVKRCGDLMKKVHAVREASQKAANSALPSLPEQALRRLAIAGIITEGSPLDILGLKVGDIILRAGRVNASNMRNVGSLIREIERSAITSIKIIVERDDHILGFYLEPKHWAGQGYMGCTLYAIR